MPLTVRRCFSDVSRCGEGSITGLPTVISFVHPGYAEVSSSTNAQPPHRDTLIALPAFDDGGIHYDTAHTACGLLAGNRWDGYFSLKRDGSTSVQPPADGILREPTYFFCLARSSDQCTSPDPYPVVARFRDWQFPHRNLPPCWERLRSRFREGVHGGTPRNCVLTDCGFSLDNAHLVPADQSRWYNDNAMMDYGTALSFSTTPVNAPTNIVSLRTDVHRMFDERNFCFVPKPAHPEDILVGHVFTLTSGNELQKLWHNREAHPGIYAASLECIFARFAWTVFSPNIFRNFLLMARKPRLLLVYDEDSGQHVSEWRDPEKCQLTLRRGQARSESPTNAQRSAIGAQTDDCLSDGFNHASSDNDGDHHNNVYLADTPDPDFPSSEVEERGRSRKRKYSSAALEEDDGHAATKRLPPREPPNF